LQRLIPFFTLEQPAFTAGFYLFFYLAQELVISVIFMFTRSNIIYIMANKSCGAEIIFYKIYIILE